MKNADAADGIGMYFVNHYDRKPTAAQFSTSFSKAVVPCAAFGKAKLIRAWRYASLMKGHCELTDGPLAGMHVLVTQPTADSAFDDTTVFVFTADYLDYDSEFRKVLDSEMTGIPGRR